MFRLKSGQYLSDWELRSVESKEIVIATAQAIVSKLRQSPLAQDFDIQETPRALHQPYLAADGVLFVSENPSQALHKVSELYDRLAFAAVGRYNEFENLRIAGVRLADMRGYAYDRRDVTGRGLANAYAQTLGTIFSSGAEKPYEIEIFVAEVGDTPEDDQVFRLTFDGQVVEEHDYAVMGGAAESVTSYLRERYGTDSGFVGRGYVILAVTDHGVVLGTYEPAGPVRYTARAVSSWFERRRGMALSFIMAGGAVHAVTRWRSMRRAARAAFLYLHMALISFMVKRTDAGRARYS